MQLMRITAATVFSCAVLCAAFFATNASADRIEEIQSQIEDRQNILNNLEKEIDQYQRQLTQIGAEKQSLENAIETLEVAQKKLAADINVTENKIESTNLQIEKLGLDIQEQALKIEQSSNVIAHTIRGIHEAESQSMVEALLAHDNLSEFWDDVESLQRFKLSMQDHLHNLVSLKEDLENTERQEREERHSLVNYQRQLAGQKEVIDVNKQEKNSLLSQTENQEANYQQLLQTKIEARNRFLRELADLESQLQVAIDPGRIPSAGKGVLAWPLDQITITQRFGNTAFAQSGAYNGQGHNGVDFAAPPGTRVKTALSGVIKGTGNTDSVPGCYSYGKWVLVQHANGLSTLYAHLSNIAVSNGEEVSTGDVIGFSGNTGYSTGPHLHFTVYATQGVQIVRLGDIKAITNCGSAYIPVAPYEAYLDPLIYL